jgi:hypothetical protein
MKQDNDPEKHTRKLFKLHEDKQGVDYTIGRIHEYKAQYGIKNIVVAMTHADGSVGIISSSMEMRDYAFMVANLQADYLKSIR